MRQTRSTDYPSSSSGSRKQPGDKSSLHTPPTTSRINITREENASNAEESDINWDEIEQTIAKTHPLFNLNIKKMADFLEDNYLISNFVSARDKHDIKFLIQLGKDENLEQLSNETKNVIKKRMALFYYITRYGWRIALDQMMNIEANQLGVPPLTVVRPSGQDFSFKTSQSQNQNISPSKRSRF